MGFYNWQMPEWPQFSFSIESVQDELVTFSSKEGRVAGILEALPPEARQDAIVDIILTEAIKTSEIEGEYPNREDVLSSIRKNLGLYTSVAHITDKSAEGLGQLMIDVRNSYNAAMTEEQLYLWHRMLLGENLNIKAGQWRTHNEPMQVVSGALGKEKVHFEAPPSFQVPREMKSFLHWFYDTAPGGKKEIRNAVIRSAVAHLYFESIHPFEDGNGRIGRVIAEKALSQTIGRPVTLSLSRIIEANKKLYYTSLERAQRSNEITHWVEYFVKTTLEAQIDAEKQIDFTLKKARFFSRFRDQFNDRQIKVIRRMLEEGAKGFLGGMNASKYVGITKASKATATRDLQQLLTMEAFVHEGEAGGRSTSYQVNLR